MKHRTIKDVIEQARRGVQPDAADVRDLLALNYETQAQAAYRIGVHPRTMRRAVSDADPYRLSPYAWAVLRLAYLLEEER